MQHTFGVIYGRSNRLGSAFIRFFTSFGPWSHGAIHDGNEVIEALIGKGVVRTPIHEFRQRYSRTELVHYDCPDPDKALQFAREQLGKGYDLKRAFCVPWRGRWDEPGAWNCNELIEAALVAGGRSRWRKEKKSVSPTETYLCL